MYLKITYLIKNDMNYEHFTLKVDFLDLRPTKMIHFLTALECKYSSMINTQIKLIASLILQLNKIIVNDKLLWLNYIIYFDSMRIYSISI